MVVVAQVAPLVALKLPLERVLQVEDLPFQPTGEESDRNTACLRRQTRSTLAIYSQDVHHSIGGHPCILAICEEQSQVENDVKFCIVSDR